MTAVQLHEQALKRFVARDQDTWRVLYSNLTENRKSMAHPIFTEGLKLLGIDGESIPNLTEVNRRLQRLTGWRGVPVTGLEMGESFYPALARREFPIGNFIREYDSLGYTPAPDIFHDLYGHIPFFGNFEYAAFCEAYGRMALKYLHRPESLLRLERFFWFTVEFALCETPFGRRIFGAGILSSRDESVYALGAKPQVLPFDPVVICRQDYRIDQIQPVLFELKSPSQLYSSLREVERLVAV